MVDTNYINHVAFSVFYSKDQGIFVQKQPYFKVEQRV